MASFTRFEDIQAWQIGRQLNSTVYRLTSTGPFERDFALRDQIRRAAISVTSNIAEGYARRTRRDFARFLTMSAASNAEVQSQLYLALDLGYIAQDVFEDTMALSRRIAGALYNLIAYLRSTDGAVAEPGAEYEIGFGDERLDDQP